MSTTRTYDVPDVSCGHCKTAIEGEVSRVEGVDTVHVDIDRRSVSVDGSADDSAIVAAIAEAGYEVAGTA